MFYGEKLRLGYGDVYIRISASTVVHIWVLISVWRSGRPLFLQKRVEIYFGKRFPNQLENDQHTFLHPHVIDFNNYLNYSQDTKQF